MSAMMEGSFIISEERQKNRLVTPRRLRCMAVLTAAAANTKQNVFINIMQKKYIKNSCCMQSEEILINTIVFFMMRSRNFEGKTEEKAV